MKKFVVVLLALLAVAVAYVLLTRNREIPVTIIQHKVRIGSEEATGKVWHAEDRARTDFVTSKHTITTIVRLDKGEVWVCEEEDVHSSCYQGTEG